MAAAGSMLLFQRGTKTEEDLDSDVWDDTALIEAYDAAVAPLKAKLAEHTGDSSLLENAKKAPTSPQSRKKRNKKKKAKAKKQQAGGWAVDDNCQAVFTEDGNVYEAKIVSIDTDDNTCVVRYLGYGNEEEQSLDDLIRADRSARKQRRSDSVSLSETDSVTSRPSTSSQKPGKKSRPSSSGPWAWPAFPGLGHGAPLPPHPPPPPAFPGMGSHPSFSVPQPPVMGTAASMPFPVMPPPPPPMPDDRVGDENEALCSMLLSWYMSGYHTGYYQGLKQGRQNDASAAMGPAR